MTVEAFNSCVTTYRRSEILRGALFMALMGAAAFPPLFIVGRLDTAGFDSTSIIVVLSSYLAIAALMFYVLSPMRKRYLQKLHADCPACGRLLLGKHAQSVMATRRCPSCGV